MIRQEFEQAAETIANGARGEIIATLADETIEVGSGKSRGKATISIFRGEGDTAATINDTARGRRQSFFPQHMTDLRRVLDEEEQLGVVTYARGKRDIRARDLH